MLLLADPIVAATPARECGEPLVDLRLTTLRIDGREADGRGGYAHVRRGVQDLLLRAEAALPHGIHLLVVEGWRDPDRQRHLYDAYSAQVRTAMPALSDADARAAVSMYISPPDVAPHPTGGAVDLTLCDADGVELDMGTALNATPIESDSACYTSAPDLESGPRENRSVLASTLTRVGLVNYPTEWWHWSYGDRYWAVMTQSAAARYDVIVFDAAATSPESGGRMSAGK